jgi:hypothetical protein
MPTTLTPYGTLKRDQRKDVTMEVSQEQEPPNTAAIKPHQHG